MKSPFASLALFLVASAIHCAEAAVVCEFQPNLDMNDCENCFKQDEFGLQLFLGGKLRASSTIASRFPKTPIDGHVYQLGVEKEKISARNGRKRLFEVCYERQAPMVFGDISLTMTDEGLQEFDLGNPGRAIGKSFQFALAGAASSGTATFFGNTLVFMAPERWSGRSTVPYLVYDDQGKRSSPGVIIISKPVGSVLRPVYLLPPEPALDLQALRDAKAAADREVMNAALREEISSIEALMSVELQQGEESRELIEVMQATVSEARQKLATIDAQILVLKKAKEAKALRARMTAGSPSLDTPLQLFSLQNQSHLVRGLSTRKILYPVNRRPPTRAPLPCPVILSSLGPYARLPDFIGLEPEDPWVPRLPAAVLRRARRSPPAVCHGRRLTKKEKKRIKKQSRASAS